MIISFISAHADETQILNEITSSNEILIPH